MRAYEKTKIRENNFHIGVEEKAQVHVKVHSKRENVKVGER